MQALAKTRRRDRRVFALALRQVPLGEAYPSLTHTQFAVAWIAAAKASVASRANVRDVSRYAPHAGTSRAKESH